jgi:hypothetical protein
MIFLFGDFEPQEQFLEDLYLSQAHHLSSRSKAAYYRPIMNNASARSVKLQWQGYMQVL